MPGSRLYIETFGCEMNTVDTAVLGTLFERRGWTLTDGKTSADLILVNTCAVREHAENRAQSRLRQYTRLKDERPGLLVGAVGCMAERMGQELLDLIPGLDLVAGSDVYRALPAEVAEYRGPKVVSCAGAETELYSDIVGERRSGVRTQVTIIRGCDNDCAYCIVPRTRGRERSRPLADVVSEVRGLSESGFGDITLLGQNVNSYYDGEHDFPMLLRALDRAVPDLRLRFLTSHPKDASRALLDAMAECPTVCEHLHLPVQAGSDRVLRAMHRWYTADRYRMTVAWARELMSDIAITTDLMVGYPGETEEDFGATLELVAAVRFDDAFTYKYSPRPGTRAYQRPDAVPEEVKGERLHRLIALQREISAERNRALIGATPSALVERPSKKSPEEYLARTRTNKAVVIRSVPRPLISGELRVAKVVETTGATLIAEDLGPSDTG
jgi:tRNA-2-methylthio-N6-dimethylallyladenosine synthase